MNARLQQILERHGVDATHLTGAWLLTRSSTRLGRIISWLCGWSHIGILMVPFADRALLWHSTTQCEMPDEFTGERIDGVQTQILDAWLDAQHKTDVFVCVRRQPLTESQLTDAWLFLHEMHGRPYDYDGAVRCAIDPPLWERLKRRLGLARRRPYDEAFCSYLAHRFAEEVGDIDSDCPVTPIESHPGDVPRFTRSTHYPPERLL